MHERVSQCKSNVVLTYKQINSFALLINWLVICQRNIGLKFAKKRCLQEQYQFCVYEGFKVALRLKGFFENNLKTKIPFPQYSFPQKKKERKKRNKKGKNKACNEVLRKTF